MERVEQTIRKIRPKKPFNQISLSGPLFDEKGWRIFGKELGILEQSYTLHKQWLGPLEDKRVLDLGCYAGNARFTLRSC